MSMIGFPLLLIPLAIYNIFVFLMPGVAFTSQVVSVTLMSRVQWSMTFGDALLALAMVLLLFEIVKASRPGTRFLTDHLLSLLVFAAAAAEFMLLVPFGTSTFFLLTVLTAVEFFAGVVIGLRHRPRLVASAVAESVRREPALSAPKQDEPKSAEFKRPDTTVVKPEPSLTAAVASDVAMGSQKPVPSPAAVQATDVLPAATDRKIADWNMSDLVSDHDAKTRSADSVQPSTPAAPEPKP